MTKPVRLRLSRAKGFDLQALSRATNGLEAVVVGRPSRWGNQFRIEALGDGTFQVGRRLDFDFRTDHGEAGACDTVEAARQSAVDLYDRWLCSEWGRHTRERAEDELRGRNLACWCPLPANGEPDCCHAAVLLRLTSPDGGFDPKLEGAA